MTTKLFTSYDAAIAFTTKQGTKALQKPYRKLVWLNGVQIPVWCVPLREAGKPVIVRTNENMQNKPCIA